ncbi:MAG: ABC transporter permease subunit [Anaerolineaceae bacterium]|nr:ABC transporter permease subunit [Anaerolineaceae bacterium]
MKHIRTIIEKEWAEVFKNRMVLMSFILMPLLFAFLPLVMLGSMGGAGLSSSAVESGLPQEAMAVCKGLSGGECIQVYMLNQFMVFFMMMPMMLPAMIAAYSIVGEKTTRSLEPLLATPVTTIELLIGKALSAALPAIGVSLLSFGIFLLGTFVLKLSPALRLFALNPVWLAGILLLGPVLAIISVIVAIFISSRVNDPRAAEQISGVLVMPLMLLFILQIVGKVVINLGFMLVTIALCALLAGGLFIFGIKVFDRENILTQWK